MVLLMYAGHLDSHVNGSETIINKLAMTTCQTGPPFLNGFLLCHALLFLSAAVLLLSHYIHTHTPLNDTLTAYSIEKSEKDDCDRRCLVKRLSRPLGNR